MADATKVKNAEQALQTLQHDGKCHSLLKKYYTKEVIEKLKNKSTSMNATLWDCIQSGITVGYETSAGNFRRRSLIPFCSGESKGLCRGVLGVVNLDSGVGIYAPDAESYATFSDLFYPIINVSK
ncbi:hypothetical protein RvY_15828 [Ramazzottius varieornatus]|uniref:Phosphagen kinase N-terminal domain-containing protein n=1 Tax=Ramazzottius varieornatus TaxID=947166 RepID=A0A1D1VWB0_RAMVA|nr:hypothetical protein RvY_15828 [Ramazzottius varieornatus]